MEEERDYKRQVKIENERKSAALQTNQFTDEVATAGLSRRGRRDRQSSSHTNAQRRHASLPFAAQSTPDFCLDIWVEKHSVWFSAAL